VLIESLEALDDARQLEYKYYSRKFDCRVVQF